MANLFIDSGQYSQGGMSLSPISWLELKAFSDCNGLNLNGWEFSQLMSMSRKFCSWVRIGGEQSDIADDVPFINRELDSTSYLIRQREASIENSEDPL